MPTDSTVTDGLLADISTWSCTPDVVLRLAADATDLTEQLTACRYDPAVGRELTAHSLGATSALFNKAFGTANASLGMPPAPPPDPMALAAVTAAAAPRFGEEEDDEPSLSEPEPSRPARLRMALLPMLSAAVHERLLCAPTQLQQVATAAQPDQAALSTWSTLSLPSALPPPRAIDACQPVSGMVNDVLAVLGASAPLPAATPRQLQTEDTEFSSDAEMLEVLVRAATEEVEFEADSQGISAPPVPGPFGVYCPVSAHDDGRLVRGDAACAVLYAGCIFVCASKEHRRRFVTSPALYAAAWAVPARVCVVGEDSARVHEVALSLAQQLVPGLETPLPLVSLQDLLSKAADSDPANVSDTAAVSASGEEPAAAAGDKGDEGDEGEGTRSAAEEASAALDASPAPGDDTSNAQEDEEEEEDDDDIPQLGRLLRKLGPAWVLTCNEAELPEVEGLFGLDMAPLAFAAVVPPAAQAVPQIVVPSDDEEEDGEQNGEANSNSETTASAPKAPTTEVRSDTDETTGGVSRRQQQFFFLLSELRDKGGVVCPLPAARAGAVDEELALVRRGLQCALHVAPKETEHEIDADTPDVERGYGDTSR